MKKTRTMTGVAAMLLLAAAQLMVGCGGMDGDDDYSAPGDGAFSASGMEKAGTSNGTGDGTGDSSDYGNTMAGVVTAGEWNDLLHWPFWSRLMTGDDHKGMSEFWGFYTNNRVAVEVSDGAGRPLCGVDVKLQRKGSTLWQTTTDCHGQADCWIGLFQSEEAKADELTLLLDDKAMEGHPAVCHWDLQAGEDEDTAPLPEKSVNRYKLARAASEVKPQADIAFIVDATGSMQDEINFLKSDLTDIIGKAKEACPTLDLRTAALFYRDEGDDYLTRHDNFTTQVAHTAAFVDEQNADGGGDYPEAVHTALEVALQSLDWDTKARTRLAFMLLDAPAHHQTDVIASLQQSVQTCARMGIKLIPVAASGVDKNTEFMLRFFAVSTGGTYVFLTDDSGVGGSHIAASVGPYEVEQLNSLIIRLIGYYTEEGTK